MSAGVPPQEGQPSEEEVRAALEAQMKRLRVEEVLLSAVADLVNLGMRRVGVVPGTEDERDLDQARTAIEAVRALGPVLDASTPEQAKPVRDALSQLQMGFVQAGGAEAGPQPGGPGAEGAPGAPTDDAEPGGPPPADEPGPAGEASGEDAGAAPGPAQRSGRLWVPGQ